MAPLCGLRLDCDITLKCMANKLFEFQLTLLKQEEIFVLLPMLLTVSFSFKFTMKLLK